MYAFGSFRVDKDQRLLFRDGEVVPLPPKTFDLLLALVENHDRVVAKEDLLKRIWPDSFVEEANLAKGVHLLRKTLGEDIIETFPKRGYRLVACVSECKAAGLSDKQIEPSVVVAGDSAEPRRRVKLTALAALILMGAAAPWALFRQTQQGINSVAVVPFQNQGAQDALVSAGFTEELIARLRTLQALRVVSPFFTGDLGQLGKRLGVQTILTGRLYYSGTRLRASAQLLSARDGSVLWADEGEEMSAADLYTAQRILASSIAARIRGRLLPADKPMLLRHGSTNTEAYELFLRGRAECIRNNEANLRVSNARAYLERAVRLDPGFADAWAWLAFAQEAEFFTGRSTRSQLIASIESAQRALSIDPDNIAARRALVYSYQSTGQAEEALHVAARALQINPTNPEAAVAAAHAYFRASMLDRAMDFYERYLVSYPDDDVVRNDLLHAAVFADSYERGIRNAQPVLAVQRLLFPTFLLYGNSGDFRHAVPMARQAIAACHNAVPLYFEPLVLKAAGLEDQATRAWLAATEALTSQLSTADNERTRIWLAMIYAQLNRGNDAREQILRALALNPGDPWILFFASETHALLGDRAAAIDCLRKSIGGGFLGLHYLDYYQKPLYGWNRYRGDSEFRSIRDGLAGKIADLRRRY